MNSSQLTCEKYTLFFGTLLWETVVYEQQSIHSSLIYNTHNKTMHVSTAMSEKVTNDNSNILGELLVNSSPSLTRRNPDNQSTSTHLGQISYSFSLTSGNSFSIITDQWLSWADSYSHTLMHC